MKSVTSNNAIFIHAAILDKCIDRLIQYLDIIDDCGLFENISHLFICFVGDGTIPIDSILLSKYKNNEKIIINRVSNNLEDYELPTLNLLYHFCKKNMNHNVLYLHTKNVGKEINLCIEDQIEYMLHFNVKKWKICIDKLLMHKTCGVDLRRDPTLHYSGNFWWSNASYIATLPEPCEFNNLQKYPNPLNSLRHNQEFWICYHKESDYHYSLWDCGINCYERHLHRYPKTYYILISVIPKKNR